MGAVGPLRVGVRYGERCFKSNVEITRDSSDYFPCYIKDHCLHNLNVVDN